eukprot:TRINITY_DN93491_c0_g1_i1.p1 TRINITY_DN93491_c0_g1~~TRINITY_DN93491_c0_g1_i1.p1  ORF type:complete len:608 (-),score=86.54 TRINITY_DN93491_c0_g1_i1:79-1902(-)
MESTSGREAWIPTTISCCMLGLHAALRKDLLRSIYGALLLSWPSQDDEWISTVEQDRSALLATINNFRIKGVKRLCGVTADFVVVMQMCVLVGIYLSVLPELNKGFPALLVLSFAHLVSIAVSSDLFTVTQFRLDCAGCCLYLVQCIRILLLPQASHAFFGGIGTRAGIRVATGLLLSTPSLNAACNLVLSGTQIWYLIGNPWHLITGPAYNDHAQQMASEQVSHVYIAYEICSFILSVMLGSVMHSSWTMQALASAKVQAFENSQHAARKLLAVLCDADILLGPDLCIVGSSKKFSHLLMSSDTLEGMPFANWLTECDQSRFNAFVQASIVQAQLDSRAPATSIHVQLRDSAGLKVKVELFHAAIPSVFHGDSMMHLIGVKDESQSSSKGSESSSPVEQGERLDLFEDLNSASLLNAWQARDEITGPRGTAQSSRSSQSVTSLGSGVTQLQELEKIVFDVNIFSSNLTIKKASCVFTPGEEERESRRLPGLQDWFSSGSFERTKHWLQHQVNSLNYGASEDDLTLDSAVELYLPGFPDLRLRSERVVFRGVAQNEDDDDEEEGSQEEDEDVLLLQLELQALSQRMRGRARRSAHPLARIDEKTIQH